MAEFNKKYQDKLPCYSDPYAFYTQNKRYKMCLKIHAAGYGDGKGTRLSVFLFLMKGQHGNKLPWPMREKFEIKLFVQISDSKHHIYPMMMIPC